MLSYVHHKNNIDVIDKYDLNEVTVSNSLVCSNINILEKWKHEDLRKGVPPMVAAVLGLNNTAAPRYASSARIPQSVKLWADIDIQQQFLDTKPTCFLILGKPGASGYSLGEAIAKKLNCIHLCPRNALIDEIEQNSLTGKCIDFNMRHNNVCKVDTILPIIKKKLMSPVVQHRGYVISGVPLVTASRNALYLLKSLHGEESVLIAEELLYDLIMNLKKKKPKSHPKSGSAPTSVSSFHEGTEEEAEEEHEEERPEEEEQEESVELPKYLMETCENVIFTKKTYYETKKAILIYQLNDLFHLEMRPDVIIYITCPDSGMIAKKFNKYMNYKTNTTVVDSRQLVIEDELRWPSKYNVSDYTSPHENVTFNPKYNCRQPDNFPERSAEQLCNYRQHISSFVENKLKDYNPKFVIKLDARTTIHEMIHQVVERIHVLPVVRPVLIPKPLYLEEPPEDMEEFWKLVEELNVIPSGLINFNCHSSPWYNRCPVELKKRHTVKGKTKFAVTFFKHVYLLSSLNALISFCVNPRPYLKLYYLETICRILVIGTKSTGKTMISECLSWLFDAPIISYTEILEKEKKNKYISFSKTILSEIIATIEDDRLENWQKAETERIFMLNEWNSSSLILLKKYIPLLTEYKNLHIDSQSGEESETEDTLDENKKIFLNKFNTMKSKLLFLPFLNDLNQCSIALKTKDLLQYAPVQLLKVTEKPAIPVLGDEDVTQAISNYIEVNELQKELEPTPEEMMNEVIKIISSIDTETQISSEFDKMYGKYIIDGFPSDPDYWGFLSDSKLLPDNTIALIENKEIQPELMKHYFNIENSLKNYQERFIAANDPLIKIRSQTKVLPDSNTLDVEMIVHEYINETLNLITAVDENAETDAELLASFSQSIDKFREDWDSIKLKLEEDSKSFIEVELEDKSDINIVEEVLLKLRQSYCAPCVPSEAEEFENQDEEEQAPKDMLTYNESSFLGDTNIYCPIAFYDHGVLWEGKPEFCIKYDNRKYNFSKEECLETFRKDYTKYQSYNKPYKKLPTLRVCVIGTTGSGKSSIAKILAKELGLLCIDFCSLINTHVMPRHFKRLGMQYENMFTDDPIDEDAVAEFQMGEENENLIADILSNETELRRMVFNYFERGASLPSVLMQKLLKRLWFEDPFLSTGFVIDGFPRLPTDVEDMIACFCIPDLIIELEGSMDIAVQRRSNEMFKTWKMQQNEAKLKAKKKFEIAKRDWLDFITKKVVTKVLCDDIFEKACSYFNEYNVKPSSTQSVIIDAHPSGSTNVDTNLFTTYNDIIQEYPEPVDESEWEKGDEARERIDARIESIYEVDDENIQATKEMLIEQRIKLVTVNATNSFSKVSRVVLSKLSNLRNRNESFFEQTFILNCDIAEMLLLQGFCFLGRFNRICPVYLYENPGAVLNLYKVSKQRNSIYPVIHRSILYFISGEESLKKFRLNPLKYIDKDTILTYHEYTLRFGIIGPPKCGKSQLAAKLAKRYGLICVSKGKAVRTVLEKMPWSNLGVRILAAIRSGECIDTDDILVAIQTVLIDHRTSTNGFVLDGFPSTPSEVVEFSRAGIFPLIVFDLCVDKNKVMEYSQNEIHYNIIKTMPPYSLPFIEHKYSKWNEESSKVRNYINKDVQNLVEINGNLSRWEGLQECQDHLDKVIPKISYYLHNLKTTIVPADAMAISNHIFQKRMSCFKHMCPVCLCKNVLKNNLYPVDKTGVVSYKDQFFWICSEHMPEVLQFPERYLNAISVDIPQIPAVVKHVNLALVYERGICIVTYAENLPAQILERGTNEFAASYKGRRYLFCSAKCHEKFLNKPHMYFDIVIFKETRNFPPVSLNKLPDVGYLEQAVGNILTEACCAVNVLRPKYPGLTTELSGLLYIALYLKVNNRRIDQSTRSFYLKAFKTYEIRSKLLIDIGLRLRSMDNPFAHYPKCCPSIKSSNSGTVCKPPSFSAAPTPEETEHEPEVCSSPPPAFELIRRRSSDE